MRGDPIVKKDARPSILVLLGCFGRGIEATGPNQNLLGTVHALGRKFSFRVLAQSVPGDVAGQWQKVSGLEQMPLDPRPWGSRGLRRALNQVPHDLIITNGFFDIGFTIPLLVMRKLGLIRRTPVMLGVHGEFSPGALAIRAPRKRAYLTLCRSAGLLDDVILQATSELEAEDIRRALPFFKGQIAVTPVIRPIPALPAFRERGDNSALRVVFLSRIDTKKNLTYALECLRDAAVPVVFDIYGPVTDESYWAQCQSLIETLPEKVRVRHVGAIGQDQVIPTLAQYDLFFLPTFGENYGHAIVDAICAGTPILISDQTPWRDLAERNAGWDLPLADRDAFITAIRTQAALDSTQAASRRAAARRYAEEVLSSDGAVAASDRWLTELTTPQSS